MTTSTDTRVTFVRQMPAYKRVDGYLVGLQDPIPEGTIATLADSEEVLFKGQRCLAAQVVEYDNTWIIISELQGDP